MLQYKSPNHPKVVQNAMDLLLKHLMDSQVDESELKEQVIPQLMQKGFKKVADLEVLEKDDLKGE